MRFLAPLAALLIALSSVATAQNSTRHDVAVVVPTILKLKIDGTEFAERARSSVAVHVEDGEATVVPDGTRLEILSNVPWQLSVAYQPSGEASGIALRWRRASGGWVRLDSRQQVVDAGSSTDGWQRGSVELALDGPTPADGVYSGTLIYVLSQP